jgi:membrane-bound inhibitor of C-type lysozyme
MRALLLATLLIAGAALAQDPPRVDTVHFEDGKTSKTLKGTVHGGESVDHRVQAHAGQVMTVKLDSPKAYFNILEPGSADVAIYNSSMDTNAWTGTLKRSGAYTVRVYQMRNNARRGNADYTLAIGMIGGKAATEPMATKPEPKSAAAKPGAGAAMTTHWRCDGLDVSATYRQPKDDTIIEVRDRVLILAHAKSGSGARFEDAKGNAFWHKGNEATLTLAGEKPGNCTAR